MKKIRQHNDIDISLLLKNSQGEILNPEQCNKMSVRLRCGGFIVYKTPTVSAGLINIRFNAYEQHRTGEYDITLSAETKDGRTFTTDICKAFCIVPCSCETGGKTDEITIDTIDVCATFDITAWGMTDLEDIDQIREGATKGMTALQEYYDDGSGEVVPVKHPDLSTQPSILPYKFAGNYVYEQMVWVDGSRFTGDVHEIDLIRFKDYNLEGKNNIILGHYSFIVGDTINGNYSISDNAWYNFVMMSDDERIFIRRIASTLPVCKGVWVRVVWTTEPNAGEYYYQQGGNEEVTLTLESGSSTIASFPMTLEIDGREFDWVDNGGNISLYGDLLDSFLSGKARIAIRRGTSYTRTITFFNSSTNERGNMFIYPGDTFDVNGLATLAHNTYSNLMRGVSQELVLVLE